MIPLALIVGEPILPPGVAVPLGALVLLLLAVHTVSLGRAEMPPSRRRIRIANGLVMLLGAPTFVYALGIARTGTPEFILSWTLVAGLTSIVLLVAFLDIANTLRLRVLAVRALRTELRAARAEAARLSSAPGPARAAP